MTMVLVSRAQQPIIRSTKLAACAAISGRLSAHQCWASGRSGDEERGVRGSGGGDSAACDVASEAETERIRPDEAIPLHAEQER